MNPRTLKYPVLLAATLALAGCAVIPAEPVYGGYDPAYSAWTYTAPPPVLQEYRGLAPMPGYVWIDGYWNWGGARYDWVPGRWEAPRPGYVWVPHVWRRDGDRWRSDGGRWEDRRAPEGWQRREPRDQGRRPDPRPEPRPDRMPEPQRGFFQQERENLRPPAPTPRPPDAKVPDEPRRRPDTFLHRFGDTDNRTQPPKPEASQPQKPPGSGADRERDREERKRRWFKHRDEAQDEERR